MMFTGIVEEVGSLAASDRGGPAVRLVFSAPLVSSGVQVGDSVAVNGCCVTVVDFGDGRWAADAVEETIARTNLGQLSPGDPVNLERALRANARLGGHLVQGHVDGVGYLVSPAPLLEISVPDEIRRYIVAKGSVAVDGVSLTVVEPTDAGFTVAIVPHTMEATTLGGKIPGDAVNLEADVVAKYVERLLAAGAESPYSTVGG